MLESLITSKTRIKLLLKFFLNPETEAYLRGLATEMGESTNGIRVELDRFTDAGFLEKRDNGKTKVYRANKAHSLFPEIQSIVRKYTGIDNLINGVLAKIGNLESAYVVGDYARGVDSGIIDVVIVGDVDRVYLQSLVEKAEGMIGRRMRYIILKEKENVKLKSTLCANGSLVVWNNGDGLSGGGLESNDLDAIGNRHY